MARVDEIAEHILYHVNAEAGGSDPSQVGDVQARAAYVRSVLAGYELDGRQVDKYEFLREISRDAADDPLRGSLRAVLSNLEARDDPSPRLALQAWVATGTEDDF